MYAHNIYVPRCQRHMRHSSVLKISEWLCHSHTNLVSTCICHGKVWVAAETMKRSHDHYDHLSCSTLTITMKTLICLGKSCFSSIHICTQWKLLTYEIRMLFYLEGRRLLRYSLGGPSGGILHSRAKCNFSFSWWALPPDPNKSAWRPPDRITV